MDYMCHHTIIITSYNKEDIHQVQLTAERMGNSKSL